MCVVDIRKSRLNDTWLAKMNLNSLKAGVQLKMTRFLSSVYWRCLKGYLRSTSVDVRCPFTHVHTGYLTELTHRGGDKAVAMLQTTFSNTFFLCVKVIVFWLNKLCSQGANEESVSIGSDNGLMPNKRQANIWMNDGQVYRRIYIYMIYVYIYIVKSLKSKTKVILVPPCSCLCPIYWSHVLSGEWRCSWSSAMLQLHLSDRQFNCQLRCVLY